ncbi:MAG TPA: right-handed parallel beta-helix repeat-containing protein [Methanomicrobiales archaeon]|nr:right-handed parallel beta-helix repeat-containing protein [Methanomicrobiales archaeon]
MATDRPREELARIISTYGREIVSDPRRCEGLLRDTCSSCDREVFILASVQKKRIPGELLALAPTVPKEILVRRLAERVVKELGFAPEHALWAVVSWARALGVLTPEDAKAIEKKGGKRRLAAGASVLASLPTTPTHTQAGGFPPESIIVSPAGDGQFRTIADAVGKVAPGARVFVRPGVYRETLRIEKPVDIIGEGPAGGTVLEAAGGPLVQSKADTFSLHGLALKSQAVEGAMTPLVEVLRGTALLEDCTLAGGGTGISIAGGKTRAILRRLSLHGLRTSGISVSGRASARVEGCRFISCRSGITAADGAEAGIRDCRVEGGSYGIEFGSRSGGLVEGTEITKYAYAGILVRDGADPGVQRCTIHHGNFGIEVSDRGKGVISDCDVSGNARGFFITRSGNPVVKRCTIHDGQFGVGASEKGKGRFEECRITGNLYAGISSRGGAHPHFLRCQVTGNRDVGVWVYEKAMATVEGCDLTGNARGPFTIEAGSKVTKKDNREG